MTETTCFGNIIRNINWTLYIIIASIGIATIIGTIFTIKLYKKRSPIREKRKLRQGELKREQIKRNTQLEQNFSTKMQCPNCGNPLRSTSVKYCPFCGYEFPL